MKTKNIFLILSIFLIGMTGCNDEVENFESIPQQEETLQLQAPNGEKIAANLEDLKAQTALLVAQSFGDDYPFAITNIEYADVHDGFLALVTYQLEDGTISNYALSNSQSVLQATAIDEFVVEGEAMGHIEYNETTGEAYMTTTKATTSTTTKYVCKSASSCSPCQVKMQIVHDDIDTSPTARGITISCTENCVDCKLKAYISEE